MTPLLLFVWFAMVALVPQRDHEALARAVVARVEAEPPLFRDDESKLRTASLVVAMGFRESSLTNEAESKTNDHCLMQIHGRPELAEDVDACLRVAFEMLRESFRMCREFPLAFYASGPGACTNERAQRISRDRMALARRLLAGVAP